MTNICFESSSGDIIMYAANDIIFKTKSWDLIVIENLTKKASLCFGNDLGQKKLSIATHGFVTRKFALINKSLLPELFAANFCDTWVTSIARMARCSKFLPHLIIEHMHPAWGKSDQDDTYAARNSSRTFLKL